MATNWTKIKNEYLNGNISYRELAKKHKVSESSVMKRAAEEKWFAKRKEQRKKIEEKILQKSVEKIADREVAAWEKCHEAAYILIDNILLSVQQLDTVTAIDKRKYSKPVTDKESGKTIKVFVEEEIPKSKKLEHIDAQKFKQVTSALKDVTDILLLNKKEKAEETSGITINISAATKADMEEE